MKTRSPWHRPTACCQMVPNMNDIAPMVSCRQSHRVHIMLTDLCLLISVSIQRCTNIFCLLFEINCGFSVLRGHCTLTTSYLKHILVQQPCPKHRDALCADDSVIPSQQIQGLHLLTVQVEGHRLILHAVGYPVPSARTNTEWVLTDS